MTSPPRSIRELLPSQVSYRLPRLSVRGTAALTLHSLNARKSLASRVQGGSHGDRYPVPVMLANVPQTPRSYVSACQRVGSILASWLTESHLRQAPRDKVSTDGTGAPLLFQLFELNRHGPAKHPLQVTIDVERTVQHDTVMEAGASSTPVEVDLGSVHKSDHDTLDSR